MDQINKMMIRVPEGNCHFTVFENNSSFTGQILHQLKSMMKKQLAKQAKKMFQQPNPMNQLKNPNLAIFLVHHKFIDGVLII